MNTDTHSCMYTSFIHARGYVYMHLQTLVQLSVDAGYVGIRCVTAWAP